MSHQYTAEILWERGDQHFLDKKYSRKHIVKFDGGIEVAASSSPLVVPLPYSDPHAMDPEEALIFAIASCHMLSFLAIAVKRGFVVDAYQDKAIGKMQPNEHNKFWVSEVTLCPKVTFSGVNRPNQDEHLHMHQEAHEECFIANSVKTDIRISLDQSKHL